MRNAEYWAKRMEAIENMSHDAGIEYARNVEEQFRKAEVSINAKIDAWYGRLAKNNGISLAEAKKLLRADELEEFHWTVEEYIEKGKTLQYSDQWAKALENASSKVHISRLEAIKLQMQQECEVLYGNLTDGLDSTLKSIYTQGYYHTAFEVQKGVGVGWGFNKLDRNKIEKAVHTCWANDGKRFSDRCWANKEKLVRELNTTLTQSIIRGEDPRKAIEQLGKRMGVAKSTAGRLIMTESAAISSMSQKDCFNELGVEEFEFIATLDSHTSEICRSMDGMHFKMSDYQIGVNAPPLHCWCRSCTAPYFDDEFAVGDWSERGEDGKTYYVPADTTYREWKSAFVDGDKNEKFKLLSDTDSESELGAFKKKIIYDEGMKKEYYKALKDKFSHGSDDAKRVFNKYVVDDSVIEYDFEGTAYYQDGKIHMHYGADFNNPRGTGATWFHEHGHMIDDLAGNISNDKFFVDALYNDFLDSTLNKTYNEVELELIDMRTQSAVSDLFNALSKDKINGVATHPLRNDGSSYWTEETLRQEAFAHMFECQFDKLRYEEMKKYFPTALAEFERILKGI